MSVDAKILSALRAAPWGVSGSELSRQLGMSRAGVWAHIEALRALGYDIEASPHLGYRLLAAPDVLHADDLCARLGATRVVGREKCLSLRTAQSFDLAGREPREWRTSYRPRRDDHDHRFGLKANASATPDS